MHYLTHTQCVVWCKFKKWSKPEKKQQTTTQCEQQQKQLKTVACVGGGIVWVRD